MKCSQDFLITAALKELASVKRVLEEANRRFEAEVLTVIALDNEENPFVLDEMFSFLRRETTQTRITAFISSSELFPPFFALYFYGTSSRHFDIREKWKHWQHINHYPLTQGLNKIKSTQTLN